MSVPLTLVKVPMLVVAETKLAIEGIVSTSTTSEAMLGPRLVKLIVYVILLPIPVEEVEAPAATLRSATLFPSQQVGGAGDMMARLQPPLKLPEKSIESSLTYKLQVPFGLKPLNADKLVPYGPEGAGLGIGSSGG